jgi:probable O-glycosylation ligase (exosortase A-associated)
VSLREILLTVVVVSLCASALVRPRLGLFGYIWYATMRPDVLAWCADMNNYSLYLAVCTLLGAVPHLANLGRLLRSWSSVIFLTLQIPLVLSSFLAVRPELSSGLYTDFVKSFVVLLLIPVLIEDFRQLKQLILLIGISVGVLGLKFGGFGIVHGGVIIVDGYGGQMSDNNLVGLALTMIIPLCWYGRVLTGSRALRWALSVIVAVSVAGVVMTNSRGSSLALGTIFVCIIVRSRRKIAALLVASVVAGAAVYLVHDAYFDRMATITHYDEEASASSRITYAKAAVKMWLDYPLLGVGFGGLNYMRLAGHYMEQDNDHVAHNSYLQMLVDSGIAAFLLYISLLFGTICYLGVSSRRIVRKWPDLACMGVALQTSLIAFAVGGTFYSSQRYDLPYTILMCSAAWEILVKSIEVEEPESFWESCNARLDVA